MDQQTAGRARGGVRPSFGVLQRREAESQSGDGGGQTQTGLPLVGSAAQGGRGCVLAGWLRPVPAGSAEFAIAPASGCAPGTQPGRPAVFLQTHHLTVTLPRELWDICIVGVGTGSQVSLLQQSCTRTDAVLRDIFSHLTSEGNQEGISQSPRILVMVLVSIGHPGPWCVKWHFK